MTAAVVLAAGAGSRFGSDDHKLLVSFRGKPLAAWAIEAAVSSGLTTFVVCGAAGEVASIAQQAGAGVVVNDRWAEGQAGSVQAGVAAARDAGHEGVVVGLADQPLVPASAWAAVAAAVQTPIAVATYDGRRGNPVRLSAEVWPLLPVAGDEGARRLIVERAELVTAVACDGEPADVDTLEDLQRWS